MKEHVYGPDNETYETRTPPIAVDLNVDFDFDAKLSKIINISYDEGVGFIKDGIVTAVASGMDERYIKPTFDAIEQHVYYKDKKRYYTTPKIKQIGGMVIVVSLPLDKVL